MELETAKKKLKPTVMPGKRVRSRLHEGQSANVRSILHANRIQPKLRVGQPNDKYERKADRVAEQVMRMPASQFPSVDGSSPENDNSHSGTIQRACAACAKDEELIQAKTTPGVTPEVTPAIGAGIQSLQGGGQPLSKSERRFFEPRIGADFSNVRVHNDMRAASVAQSIGARAFTLGNNVAFGAGEYSPNTLAGRKLLAHELTHVAQQGSMPGVIYRYSTSDCSDADVVRVDAAHQRALDILTTAIARLTADPVTAETQTLFAYHFGAYANWRRSIVLDHFNALKSLLEGDSVTYQCESDCSDAPSTTAYTYWVFGDIHVCESWLRSEGLTETGESFIHELQHLRGSFDLGYHRNNVDNDTIWSVAVNNADAFSELAQDLYEQP